MFIVGSIMFIENRWCVLFGIISVIWIFVKYLIMGKKINVREYSRFMVIF